MDPHATPAVYLGIDSASRAYLLGSLYDLCISVSVNVTFFQNVFPFRKIRAHDAPSSLLWCSDSAATGSSRLGQFDTFMDDTSGVRKVLDRNALKAIGAVPFTVPLGAPREHALPNTSVSLV